MTQHEETESASRDHEEIEEEAESPSCGCEGGAESIEEMSADAAAAQNDDFSCDDADADPAATAGPQDADQQGLKQSSYHSRALASSGIGLGWRIALFAVFGMEIGADLIVSSVLDGWAGLVVPV